MTNKSLTKISKFLSLILRHKPETIGISLDDQGWVNIDYLIAKTKQTGQPLTRALLDQVVEQNDKQRFAISQDGLRIRANQGHSVQIDLALPPTEPPMCLYHGTPEKNLTSVLQSGLHKGQRHHVHLSLDTQTATKVGARRGKPVILVVQAKAMHKQGHLFYLSANGVWLVDTVPAAFISQRKQGAQGQ